MKLRTIQGRAGTGKTTMCLHEIAAAQAMDEKHTLLYIVPEQFSLLSEKALLAASDGSALSRAETMGFRRLAFRVFAELGGSNCVLLDDVGQSVILRKILFDVRSRLAYFQGSVDKQGFVDKLSAMLRELYQYEIRPDALKQAAGRVIGDENLRLKLHDLAIILEAYDIYLLGHAFTGEDALDILADRVEESAIIRGAHIWIDGFKSFTPQEYRVLLRLLVCAESVTIAMTTDSPAAGYPELQRQDAFYETKNTLNTLFSLANDYGVDIEAPIALQSVQRHAQTPALSFLEKNFLGYRRYQYAGDASCVRLMQADNMYEELHAAARTILALTREKGYRYSDIGVVCASHEAYAKSVDVIFGQYNIPVFIDAKEDALSHPLTEYIRAAFEIVGNGWQYESVFRFLKTGMTSLTRAEIDRLENYVLAYGIRFNRWQKEWEYGFDGAYENFNHDEINALRVRVINILEPLTCRFTRTARRDAAEYCRAIYTFMENSGTLQLLSSWMQAARAKGDNLMLQTHTQIWDSVSSLLDKIFETLGQERLTPGEFARILEAGFSSISLGLVPPSLDQVIVGDLRRSRLPEVKALLLLGASESALPERAASNSVLSDEERQMLATGGVTLAPDTATRAAENNFNIYTILAKPSEFLYISCPLGALDGKAIFPSPIMARITELLPTATRLRAGMGEGDEMACVAAAGPSFDALTLALRNYAETGTFSQTQKAVYMFFRENATYREALTQTEAQIVSVGKPERLLRETVYDLYGGRIVSSVTQLERYAQCPFSYFVRYNLRALERKLYEVEAVQLGTLFHAALELYVKRLMELGLDWNEPDEEMLIELAMVCVDEALTARGNEILRTTGQYRHFSRRVKEIAVQSIRALTRHMRGSGFAVASVESGFGDDSVRVPLEAGEMELRGRVDRVDVLDTQDSMYVKLVDYKSGHKEFNLSEVYYGLQLQLVLYIDAVLAKMKARVKVESANVLPAAVLFFRMQNPKIEFDAAFSEEQLREKLLAQFQMSGLVLNERCVLENLDENLRAGQSGGVKSSVVPVTLNAAKKEDDFLLSKSSKAVSAGDFQRLMVYTMQKAASLGDSILSGDVTVWPCLHGKESACRFCDYRAVCGFEPGESKYHVMKKLKASEERSFFQTADI